MTTSTTFRSTSREQDNFAEQLAESCESVEVRLLHDGIAAVIRHGVPSGEQVVFLVDEDGEPLGTSAVVERKRREAERVMAVIAEQGPAADLRALAADAMRPWPQYDGNYEAATVALARRRIVTKGGLVAECDEPVLITRQDAPSYTYGPREVTLFSFRRLGHVAARASDVRAL